jgi:AAA family ATP:ADP antiporter
VLVIAQLWAFANDIYSNERGKRLFPLINLGASLGAVVGAGAATLAFADVSAYRLMLLAAVGLSASIALTLWVNRRERAAGRDAAGARAEEPLGKTGGFQLVLRDRYLFLIAMFIVVLNVVNTLGGFLLNTLIRAEALQRVAPGAIGTDGLAPEQVAAVQGLIGTMAGTVQTSVNLLAFLIGAFLVSRIMKYMGVRGAMFILPLIALGTYSMMAIAPVLAIVRVGKILENSTDYSVQNTARHSLFLPTSREAKYKAKQAIDTFFWRAGDFLQAIIVFTGVQLAFGVRQYAAVNMTLTIVWLVLVVAIVREHRKLTRDEPEEKAA